MIIGVSIVVIIQKYKEIQVFHFYNQLCQGSKLSICKKYSLQRIVRAIIFMRKYIKNVARE